MSGQNVDLLYSVVRQSISKLKGINIGVSFKRELIQIIKHIIKTNNDIITDKYTSQQDKLLELNKMILKDATEFAIHEIDMSVNIQQQPESKPEPQQRQPEPQRQKTPTEMFDVARYPDSKLHSDAKEANFDNALQERARIDNEFGFTTKTPPATVAPSLATAEPDPKLSEDKSSSILENMIRFRSADPDSILPNTGQTTHMQPQMQMQPPVQTQPHPQMQMQPPVQTQSQPVLPSNGPSISDSIRKILTSAKTEDKPGSIDLLRDELHALHQEFTSYKYRVVSATPGLADTHVYTRMHINVDTLKSVIPVTSIPISIKRQNDHTQVCHTARAGIVQSLVAAKIKSVRISGVCIPKTHNNITKNNNKLAVRFPSNLTETQPEVYIIIPEGRYTLGGLIKAVNAQFTEAGIQIVCSMTLHGHVQFTTAGAESVHFDIACSIGNTLGFSNGYITPDSSVITSESIPTLDIPTKSNMYIQVSNILVKGAPVTIEMSGYSKIFKTKDILQSDYIWCDHDYATIISPDIQFTSGDITVRLLASVSPVVYYNTVSASFIMDIIT